MKKQKITYAQVGDNYDTKDPTKKLAQTAAADTAIHLKNYGFSEVSETRGESAFVWQQGKIFMAAVIEGLGTKNIVADGMYEASGNIYYDIIAHDTVATIINDLTTVGAKPLVLHAYWAIENNDWLQDKARMEKFIVGWKNACDLAGATWGGGETPTLKGIIQPGTIAIGGSAVGIIASKKRLIIDTKLKSGDRIILLKSNGINANGLSLARAIAKKLPKGYMTLLPNGKTFGEALLSKSNIYARCIQTLLDANINIHYLANITGHGLRKVMRARGSFSYVIEKIFEPQEEFLCIQNNAHLTDYDMYEEYNMGMDYAIFLPEKDVKKAQTLIKKSGFESIHAGYIEKGEKQVVIEPKQLTYKGDTLDLR